MSVIDAHQHIWDLSASPYPWLTGLAPIDRTLTMADIAPALARNGVDGVILVQSDDTPADTDLMLAAAAADARVAGVVAYAPLHAGEAVREDVSRLRQNPLVVGVRTLIHAQPDPGWAVRADYLAGLGELARADLAWDMVGVLPDHLDQAVVIADRYPHLRVVLDHLGHPPVGGEARMPWWDQIARVAERPNVAAKLSGLYATVGSLDSWTIDDVRPFVDRALEVFGPDRLMFGGDWPIVDLAGGYDRVAAAVRELCGGLSAAEQAEVFGGTARRIYRLDRPESARIAHRSHV